MKVLIACEYSGIVREAFKAKGHDAWSCDLLDTEIPGNHIQGNVLNILGDKWDLMIAFTPCTFICNSGVRWLYEQEDRWTKMHEAAAFFRYLLYSNIEKIGMENPIPHKYAIKQIGRKYNQLIQPWQFGHGETKATCLWLKGLPKLKPTKIVNGREARIHKMAPSPERSKERSRTFPGIAKAMAEQWG